MKKIALVICLFAISVSSLFAQEKPDAEKMIKERVANMRANLKLGSNEGKAFWTAYEQFLRNEMKCHETYKTNLEKKGIKSCPGCTSSCESMTDAQLTYMRDQRFRLRQDLLNLETNFYKKLKTMLTPRQINDFYNIDEKFKRSKVTQKKCNSKEVQQTSPVNGGKKKR